MTDIPRIETEQARTRRALARVEADIARARAALNALLRREADAPLGPPSDVAPETVPLPLDELLSLAARARGDLGQARARIRAAHARTEAASAESRWPTITAALSYWQDPQMRPGLGATVAAALPWVWAGARERLAEARERELAESEGVESVTVTARGEVTVAHARLHGLERELVVLRREARPAAARSTDALRAAYAAGRGGLLDWIDAARQLHDIGEEEADVTASMVRTAADLERAVGVALPRSTIAIEEGGAR
ncbi:MAG: TolC family protein [Myxococcaceae bacterium]|nr:MAG: TolC family protein [Myxococcaceae bacterium]